MNRGKFKEIEPIEFETLNTNVFFTLLFLTLVIAISVVGSCVKF